LLSVAARAQTVTATLPAGNAPLALAVNPLTNRIYAANGGSNNITVIDGATNATTTVTDPNALDPCAVAVNPVTNRIYVANADSNNVTVIDGATNGTTTVPVGNGPLAVAVNAVTNQVYVANYNSGSVTVIDGPTNATATVAAGNGPWALKRQRHSHRRPHERDRDGGCRKRSLGADRQPGHQQNLRDQPLGRQRDGNRRGNESHQHTYGPRRS
jgi:YVTN family beta-propeller protein